MKRFANICTQGALLPILIFGWSGRPAVAEDAFYSRAEEQIRKLEADWAAAVATNDPDQIGRFFTDDFLFVGAGGLLQDRDQHLADFRSGTLKIKSVKIDSVTIHGYDSFAVASTLATVTGRFTDRDISGTYRFMDTWRTRGRKWLAVSRQQTLVGAPFAKATGTELQGEQRKPATPYQRTPLDHVTRPEPRVLAGSLPKSDGTPTVLFFVKGSFCAHCMSQVSTMAMTLSETKAQVSVISP